MTFRSLEAFEQFGDRVQQIFDKPTANVELLQNFLQQSEGKFSQRACNREHAELANEEAGRIEELCASAFGHAK